MVTALSTPNIAFTKYWGNHPDSTSLGTTTGHRNAELRIPVADSLSMTLDSPTVEVSAEPADRLTVRSFDTDGTPHILSEKELVRFGSHLSIVNTYLSLLELQTIHGLRDFFRNSVALTIHSHIPPAIGLASSAALFSAIAKAYAGLAEEQGMTLTNKEISVLARLGSGSAARSVLGGFVALHVVDNPAIAGAYAVQVADEHHWPLHDIVVCPSLKEKEHGSTEGHHLAHTSPHFKTRIENMPRRQQECIDAILKKDFEKLQHVAEKDAWDLHKVAETSVPPLRYLTEDTHRITREITELRNREHLAVLFTMDAGPTVHLICTEESRPNVLEFAHAQHNCTVFETKVGSGARMVERATVMT